MHALAEWFFVVAFTLAMAKTRPWWRKYLASPRTRTIKWKQTLRAVVWDSRAGRVYLN